MSRAEVRVRKIALDRREVLPRNILVEFHGPGSMSKLLDSGACDNLLNATIDQEAHTLKYLDLQGGRTERSRVAESLLKVYTDPY